MEKGGPVDANPRLLEEGDAKKLSPKRTSRRVCDVRKTQLKNQNSGMDGDSNDENNRRQEDVNGEIDLRAIDARKPRLYLPLPRPLAPFLGMPPQPEEPPAEDGVDIAS